jgi:hypothetical protein
LCVFLVVVEEENAFFSHPPVTLAFLFALLCVTKRVYTVTLPLLPRPLGYEKCLVTKNFNSNDMKSVPFPNPLISSRAETLDFFGKVPEQNRRFRPKRVVQNNFGCEIPSPVVFVLYLLKYAFHN